MAELLGAVASGAGIMSLAVQIGGSLVQLKSFWDEVKDAPDTITSLIEHIEDLNELVAIVELQENDISGSIISTRGRARCIAGCKRAADQLKQLVDELSVDIKSQKKIKRNWTAAKVVLKKDRIERFKVRLGRAVDLLVLALQMHNSTLLQMQPDIIIARLSHRSNPTEYEGCEDVSSVNATRHNQVALNSTQDYNTSQVQEQLKSNLQVEAVTYQKRVPKLSWWHIFGTYLYGDDVDFSPKRPVSSDHEANVDYEGFVISYRMPFWILNRVWELQGRKAGFGWKFNILPYNIISWNSQVFDCAQNDDVVGLQNLFKNRLASPFDRNEEGETALHIAAENFNHSACSFLLNQGADIEATTYHGRTPLFRVCGHQAEFQMRTRQVNTLRLLINEAFFDDVYLSIWTGSEEGFDLLINTDVNYFSRPLLYRAAIAMDRAWQPRGTSSSFRKALGQKTLPNDVDSSWLLNLVTWRFVDSSWLLNLVAWRIVDEALPPELFDKYHFYERHEILNSSLRVKDEGWAEILEDSLSGGTDLHARYKGITPLLHIIYLLIQRARHYHELTSSMVTSVVILWLDTLTTFGIDLLQYGRKEKELFQLISRREFNLFWTNTYVRLIGFQYGAEPEDWKFWVSEPTDEFAGQFWYMIENPWETTMVGAWVD